MKHLKGVFDQSLTNKPDVIEIDNNFGSIAWSYDNQGMYIGTGCFAGWKIHSAQHETTNTNQEDQVYTLKVYKSSDTEIRLETVTPGFSAENNLLKSKYLEILFFP